MQTDTPNTLHQSAVITLLDNGNTSPRQYQPLANQYQAKLTFTFQMFKIPARLNSL